MTKEWQEASNEMAIKQKQNPITGKYMIWRFGNGSLIMMLIQSALGSPYRYCKRGLQRQRARSVGLMTVKVDIVPFLIVQRFTEDNLDTSTDSVLH